MLSRLCVSSHPAAAWAEAAAPWLREHGASWHERRAVLAPNAAWIAAIKAGVISRQIPVLGLEWFTPGHFRSRALPALPGPARRVALREDLHLLLELAASSLPANPLARAYGADPASFQELLDSLESSGWDLDVLPDAHARELARAAAQLRVQTGLLTSAAADRALREAAAAGSLPRMGEHLLAIGFGPGEWPRTVLLEAAASAYEKCELVLDVPSQLVERDMNRKTNFAVPLEGFWEEKISGGAEQLEAPVNAGSPSPALWLAENLDAEADLVVAQALAFLGDGDDARVGIVVGSAASPLAREVAARFTALGCPHHDATGYLPGRESAQALFEAWLDWQEDGRLAGFVAWARAAERNGMLSEKSASNIEESLQKAAQALLADDPSVLAAWLKASPENNMEANAILAEWPRLPASAKWDDFLEKIISVSQKLQWPSEPAALAQRAADWRGKLAADVPRAALLRWLRAVSRIPGRTRAAIGREPWAKLQIIDAASAAAQTWTHLVLGGLVHGEWPAEHIDSPLLGDALVEKLNAQATIEGSHGEGHWTLAPGRAWLPTSSDARQLDRANFSRLLTLPSRGLALTACETDPADGRRSRLSEFFWAAASSVLGRLPSESDWNALAKASRAQRQAVASFPGAKSLSSSNAESVAAPGAEQTAHAFNARRDGDSPFDEFSFCLSSVPPTPLRLSCKAWEEALTRPGASWFKYLLHAKPRWDAAEDDTLRLSIGLWAHQFARLGPDNARESFPPPNLETWRRFATDTAEKSRAAAAAAFAATNRALPEAWLDAQAAAARLADGWIASLAGLPGWPHALCEIKLPHDLLVEIQGLAEKIPLTGRLDLVLFSKPVVFVQGKISGANAWLFDFKSGGDDKLSIKNLASGKGMQLALYARALLALGTGDVALTLLNADADAEPQLLVGDLEAPELALLWKLLGEFALQGHWGEKCDIEDEHARSGDYPSATLPVPADILRAKWALSHKEAL